MLAALNLCVTAKTSLAVSFHLTSISLIVCALYIYRDIWPLLTFHHHPLDDKDGILLWAQVTLVLYVGVIGPLLEPYPYIPIDPKVRDLGSGVLPVLPRLPYRKQHQTRTQNKLRLFCPFSRTHL